MRLYCDSGSSKALWSDGSEGFFRTSGCNPRFLDEGALEAVLREELFPQLPQGPIAVTEVFFYGAGCAAAIDRERVRKVLQKAFPNAPEPVVDSDIVGAATLLCTGREGVVCILGTGSNCVRWDGRQIVDAVPALGFYVGDEGSGAELGKRLLKGYFYRELPDDLRAAFQQAYPGLDRASALEALYDRPLPNRWCASFATFYAQHRGCAWIEEQLYVELDAFATRRVAPMADARTPIHAVGGIAYHFRDVWEKCLMEKNWRIGAIKLHPF